MIADAAAASYPPRHKAWLSAIIVFVITAIAMADRMAIAMLIGPIKREFGIGDFQASLLVGLAFTLFYVLFLLPIGWAADRWSRRKVLAACLTIWSLATVSCGFAGGFVSLFVLRMLVGAGEAGMAPTVHAIIGNSFPRHALAKPLALQGIGFQTGSALGLGAAGAILTAGAAGAFAGWPVIGEMDAWRISFVLIGLPGLLAVALVPLLQDCRPIAETQAAAKTAFLPFLRQNSTLVALLLLTGGFTSVGLGGITGWLPEFMQRSLGMTPMAAGATMGSALLLTAFIGQGGYSILVDFFAARGMTDAAARLGLVPVALAIPISWFAYQAATTTQFTPWLIAMLLCIAPTNAMCNTITQMIAPPALRSRMTALMILAISVVGFAGGPALVGWLSQYVVGEARLGLALQLVTCGAMAISFVLLLLLRPRLALFIAARDAAA